MYDLTDLIFEKYTEGKLTEEKMMMLLEASSISLVEHELPLSYKGVKLRYYNDAINEKTDMPYIKNALKILNSASCEIVASIIDWHFELFKIFRAFLI